MSFRYQLFRIGLKANAIARRLPGWLRLPIYLLLVILLIPVAVLFACGAVIWGLIQGIRFRLFPPKALRNVSRLGSDESDLDAISEAIEDEGQPLREHHRRLIFRDPRLLPKPKPPANIWPRPRRKKVMTSDEATRLFAGTLRTRNRRIRDLLADEQQLSRLGLPVWKTEEDLAAALAISVSQLRSYAIHRNAEHVCHYVTFVIPKRNGEPRLIMAPKRRLKQIQRTLLRLLVDKLPLSDQAHGFRSGRSIRTGADPHVGRAVVVKLDLKDFFPSVTYARVRGLLVAYGYGYTVATTLAVLMTEADRQPVELDDRRVFVPVGPRHCVQGAPTSPGLCNAICLRLDRRLAGLAKRYGWSFTRYADDLTFSGNSVEHATKVLRLAERTCHEEGFVIRSDKTRVLRRGGRQSVTGVVVNDTAGLSRKERRRLRSVIHRLKSDSPARPATLTAEQLAGKLAYLRMLNPEQAAALQQRWQDAT